MCDELKEVCSSVHNERMIINEETGEVVSIETIDSSEDIIKLLLGDKND